MSILEAIIIAIVEGLTEFIPVSSTGHMIITQHLLGVQNSAFVKLFVVNIQLGAILSVVILFWKRLFDFRNLIELRRVYLMVSIAFVPAAIFGFCFSDFIDSMLESPLTIGISLFVGGVVLIFVDKIFKVSNNDHVFPDGKQSLVIGLCQCISMIPGVSRSAATIIGGLSQGLSRKVAAEFSFFLAIPTMLGATLLKMKTTYDVAPEIFSQIDNIKLLIAGNLVAFIVGAVAIKFFVGYLSRHGMAMFGWYRMVVGIIIIALFLSGSDLIIL